MAPPSDVSTAADRFASEVPSLLRQANISVFQLTSDGEFCTVDAAVESLSGYPRETLLGRSITTVLESTPPSLDGLFDSSSIPADPLTPTLSLETADGSVVVCESFLKPVPGGADDEWTLVGLLSHQEGHAPGAAPSFEQTNETASAKAFVALADSVSDGIIVLDADSQIQYANPAVERILGYEPEELVGGSKLNIIPERLRQTHLEALDAYLETGERNIDWEYVELPGHHKDGHEVPLGISLNEFSFGGAHYFVGLFRDVSPRKETERALREEIANRKQRERELARFKRAVEASGHAIYMTDETGTITYVNSAFEEITGYSEAEAIGSTPSILETDDHGADGRQLWETVLAGDVWHAEVVDERNTGETYHVEQTIAPVTNDDGQIDRLIAVLTDVTERKEREVALEKSNERLEQFAYAASHDLQEPLRMVSSYLQLIENRYGDDLDEEGREFLAFAVDGADRMRTMIDALLEYSRVETRGEPLEPVDLDAVLEATLEDLHVRIDREDASITAESLPTVRGDSAQLGQVFQNLLSNAIEYSGDEPPRVYVEADRCRDEWQIAVRDEGIGIPAEEQDRIFRVFERLHSRAEYDGTGIGLALCQRIVERHGGELWVESEPGCGSTFFLTLPAISEQ